MSPTRDASPAASDHTKDHIQRLVADLERNPTSRAVRLLKREPAHVVAEVLLTLDLSVALKALARLKRDRRNAVLALLPPLTREQWTANLSYPVASVGRLMERPVGLFRPELTVREVVEQLRLLVKGAFITYGYVTDAQGTLLGVLVMRDLLLAEPTARVTDIMLRDPFALTPRMPVAEAVRAVWTKHFPVYPVCDDARKIVGLVRGSVLFEEQNTRISAQAGSMVGVEESDRLATPWLRSLTFRHPWLQINLLTAFLAAAVVGAFEGTIQRIVVLAAFLPVLAGQSGNTGCQALAVALRGITLGDLTRGKEGRLLTKEAWLGFLNGALVGVVAAAGMYVYARMQGNPRAPMLAMVVFLAMVGSCVISGVSGGLVPITLKKLGFDPATASSIFVTTSTDVASIGLFLGLATLLVR